MKRLLVALGIAAAVFVPALVSAQQLWNLDKFRSDIVIGADGVVSVTETVDADFTTPRHGIYRYIPTQGKDTAGESYVISVKLLGVTRDGRDERADSSYSGDNLVWRVGDPNLTLEGKHEYVLRYSVTGAIGRFADFDELYWNVSGEGWDVPLPTVSATVTLPPGVKELQSACYTGPYGSKESDCQILSAEGQDGFVTKTPGEALTVAVGFPKGAVAEPPKPSAFSVFLDLFFVFLLPLLLPIAAFILLFRLWRKRGRDRRFEVIVAQYGAPDDLRPAEVATLLRQRGSPADLAPTVVDLAVRGYLRIEETKAVAILPSLFGANKDYLLHLVKSAQGDASLSPYENALLDAIFGAGAAPPAEALVSALAKDQFYLRVQEMQKAVLDGLTQRGYFDADSRRLQGKLVLAGVLLLFLGPFIGPLISVVTGFAGLATLAVSLVFLIPSIMLCGVMSLVFGVFMMRWTDQGHLAAWQARGYKEFIGAVEKYRAPWMETQDVFEKTLPYAMAFGLGSRWAKAFETLQLKPPQWYQGAALGVWSPVSFERSLSSWSTAIGAVASPRSSGSGSGGGGFSGGGGGGGGGGSW